MVGPTPAAAIQRSDDLRRQNKRRILAALRVQRALARTELAAATGLSASTVSAATSELIATGHLVQADVSPAPDDETGRPGGGRGRPRVALSRRPGAASVAALTITVNAIQVDLVDFAGDTVCTLAEPSRVGSLGRSDFAARIVALVERASRAAPKGTGPLSSVAVAVQGVVDASGEVLHWSPMSPRRNLALAAELSGALGVEARLANDADMIATALHHDEPERFGGDFAAVLLSYGVGMGMFLGGELFHGARTSAAEIGHVPFQVGGALCRCGRLGCVEAYASEYGIWRIATGADPCMMPAEPPDRATMAALVKRAASGDARAAEAYRTAGRALGHAVLTLYTVFDPMTVAFVGSGTLAQDLWEPLVRDALCGPSTGLPYEGALFYGYAENIGLMSRGTVITALSNLDRTIDVDRLQSG